MSEDRRTARNPREPAMSGTVAPWADYLDWVRGDIVRAVLAMDREEQRRTRVPSGWTPIELLSHVVHMEQRWFVWGFLGEQVDDPWGDWNVAEPWLSDDETLPRARWQVAADVTAEDLADRLAEIGRRTREVLDGHALGERASTGGRFAEDPPTLEWICFHVLTEYARHAGHLDLVVEIGNGPSDGK